MAELDVWAAAEANDVTSLSARLVEGSDTTVDLRNTAGATPLHVACSKGHLRAARFLLERAGANVHARDGESGWTALHRALYHGHVSLALLLLRHGAWLGDAAARDPPRPWFREPRIDGAAGRKKTISAAAATAAPAEGCYDYDGHSPWALLALRLRPSLRRAQAEGGEVYSFGSDAADFQLGSVCACRHLAHSASSPYMLLYHLRPRKVTRECFNDPGRCWY